MFCADIIGPLVKRVMRALGINEKTPVFTYDGNMDGKEVFNNGGLKAVRVGDIIDLNSIQKVIGIMNGEKIVVTPEYITVKSLMPGMTAAVSNNIPLVMVLQIDGYSAGTYVIHSNEQNYVEYVELTTTTTPISDKYLPEGFGGGGLPVVELSTVVSMEELVELTAEENAKMDKATEHGTPIIVSLKMQVGEDSYPCSFLFNVLMGNYVAVISSGQGLTLVKDGDGWAAYVAEI